MKDNRLAIDYRGGRHFLFDSTYRTLPFSIVTASLLALYLYLNGGHKVFIILWLASLSIIVAIRMLHCKFVMHNGLYDATFKFHLRLFVFLIFITSLIWMSIYFLSVSYTGEAPLYLIILVYGAMVAGSTSTLGVYYPAYYVYLFFMLVPVVIYNYAIADINHIILATLILTYTTGVSMVAKSHQDTLRKALFLTEQNKDLLEKFEMLSITDSLTGLYNRRHFTELLQETYNLAKNNQQSIILVSIDIDNFKLVNDNFGHPFGDRFLIYTAEYLNNYLLPVNGMIFRLGGDEYASLIVNMSEDDVKKLCYVIKNNFIKNPQFDHRMHNDKHKNILEQVTLSIGVVYIPYDSATNMEQIIDKADQLLYQAKSQGKNEIKYTRIL